MTVDPKTDALNDLAAAATRVLNLGLAELGPGIRAALQQGLDLGVIDLIVAINLQPLRVEIAMVEGSETTPLFSMRGVNPGTH
jgi:hypothetical protein